MVHQRNCFYRKEKYIFLVTQGLSKGGDRYHGKKKPEKRIYAGTASQFLDGQYSRPYLFQGRAIALYQNQSRASAVFGACKARGCDRKNRPRFLRPRGRGFGRRAEHPPFRKAPGGKD